MASEATKRSLIEHFSALKDPRQAWKVVYPLPEIMLLVLCATLAGAEDFVEARLWGVKNLAFLRRFLPFKDGLPSHDTLNDVINALDPALFKTCFVAWVEELREAEPDMVAIDGKTSRRTHNRRKGREPLHLVSAWAARQRLVLGQEATDAKSNEITAIPLLLERLALTGALVTIDAMGCQTKIAQAIQAKGADYLLAVKDNWPTVHGEIERFFEAPADGLDRHATTDGDHGRIEIRRHVVSHDVAWLSTTWLGSRPTAASRASRAFRVWPPSPWSRPKWSGTAGPPSRAATIFLRRFSMPRPSPVPLAAIGALRIGCIGLWT